MVIPSTSPHLDEAHTTLGELPGHQALAIHACAAVTRKIYQGQDSRLQSVQVLCPFGTERMDMAVLDEEDVLFRHATREQFVSKGARVIGGVVQRHIIQRIF